MNVDTMPLHPLITPEKLETVTVEDTSFYEPKFEALQPLLANAAELQQAIANLPLKERLEAIRLLGEAWQENLERGRLEALKRELHEATGYSPQLLELEMEFVTEVLNPENIIKLLDHTLIGGSRSLEEPVEVSKGEYLRNLPAGPALIIGSGNSLIPPLIPTTISLVIGNFTILRPSIANFKAVREVYRPLQDLHGDNPLRQALAVSYFAHESRNLKALLEKAPLGIINYWGGEPGRTAVSRLLLSNPHRPRLIVNGPMTGFAIIDSANATTETAEKLALETVLYDQQLCSSPTQAAFVGSKSEAIDFAEKLAASLDKTGRQHPLKLESLPYPLFIMRRSLELAGAKVYGSTDPSNPWTVVLSEGQSTLQKLPANTIIPFYARKRFLEIIVVPTIKEALDLVVALPRNPAYAGVDRVQTLSLAVTGENLKQILSNIHRIGVYRAVPLGESYLRTPSEPYDGVSLPQAFSYTAYIRVRSG